MYNWSTNPKKISKNSEKYIIWKLEQIIDFGLSGDKLREKELRKYWDKISIDPGRRKFLELFLNERDTY